MLIDKKVVIYLKQVDKQLPKAILQWPPGHTFSSAKPDRDNMRLYIYLDRCRLYLLYMFNLQR